jgi:hypothetical protein
MVTSRPTALRRSQRYCGSAAVQRKRSSSEAVDRAVVDDLAVLVAPRRVVDLADLELRRVAGDDPVDERSASRPETSYLNSGETSMRAACSRMALYSMSWKSA